MLLEYLMCHKEESKLELATSMVCQIIPDSIIKKYVVILCDSWYIKKDLVCAVNKYPNLNIIHNVRYDSIFYDLVPKSAKRKGILTKHGHHFPIHDDFFLSVKKRLLHRYPLVPTNIFNAREVLVYVTSTEKNIDSKYLFFNTAFPSSCMCSVHDRKSVTELD